MKANAALLFVASEYDTARKDLKGRHAATEGFFKGFAEHATIDKFFCWSAKKDDAAIFRKRIEEWGRREEVKWLPLLHSPQLGEAGCAFIPGPVLIEDAWRRRSTGDHLYSLCGVSHTTASHVAMEAFSGLLTAPVRSWDAIICPSQSILKTAQFLIRAQADYLQWRLGAQKVELPQLPVIPLGIDCAAYAFDEKARQSWRQKLSIGPEDIALLFVGRLSFHAKAHPMPMYLAAQAAYKETGKKIHLIQAGWFANDFIANSFSDGAQQFCPDVTCHFLDGTQKAVRREIWSAADIFVSFSDNIQETFGLTPVEAMAAGLPVLASDWNGYRETVRHGIDGFLAPTMMPPPPLGDDLARAHDYGHIDYDKYCGFAGQLVLVDNRAASEYLVRLIENPSLRKQMGEAGLARAKSFYDWSVIIPQYQDLWAELATRRAKAAPEARPSHYRPAYPARPDPFFVFSHYPTQLLDKDTVFKLVGRVSHLRQRYENALFRIAHPVLPSFEIMEVLLKRLEERGSSLASDLVALAPEGQRPASFRALIWLTKIGLIQPEFKKNKESTATIDSL